MDETASSDLKILAIPVLRDYWIATRAQSDFDNVYTLIMGSWASPTVSPYEKMAIARDGAKLLYEVGSFRKAWEMLKQAVEIIILACPRNLPQVDQSFIISTISGLSNDACAMGIAADVDLVEVLQTLESGRGLAVSLAHAANDDYQHLGPELQNVVADFEDCRAKLFFLSMSSGLIGLDGRSETSLGLVKSRAEIKKEFELLSKTVQEHPELEVVLQQPTVGMLQSLASNGPLVVVNSSQFRNDAILWRTLGARNTTLLVVMNWLWDLVVSRVCQELQLPSSKHDELHIPRLWWLPTGFFTQMPFHAAGDYFDGSSSDLMASRAISSYTSSFRMLSWARSKSLNLSNLKDGKLDGMIVTMALPRTKRRPRGTIFVRTAEEEADAIEHEAINISWLRKDKPSAADVVAELPAKNFMHFCCHGESDPKEPAQSHLKLFKRTTETIDDVRNIDRLAAKSVATASSQSSVLVVLSACFTADIQLDSHLDEGLHIGNAFQMAGFPHVIGSSWAASDAICPSWSRLFYLVLNHRITQNAQMGSLLLTNYDIALAYDMAVNKILREDPFWPILWAPFVHIGP
ncbi:hypothetical protein EK21DRAFT_75241 [Setomelanomma holmii]|uniref:CHAT domain-containing protein n=1 Tax=Setomelanomma holmii TaxID=210430 RepID=A0A9P4LJC6_9PLEO|nr:hypothetical protein EK21DRAFT_75241 [Setomelanomma holmii]